MVNPLEQFIRMLRRAGVLNMQEKGRQKSGRKRKFVLNIPSFNRPGPAMRGHLARRRY